MRTVTTNEDLAKAVDEKEDTIEVKGDLANKVITIKATGTVAWLVAIGLIGAAVVAILAAPTTAGTSAIPGGVAFVGIATALGGTDVALVAIGIAVASGGVGVLNQLREYSIIEKESNRVVLKR